jgi:adenosylhomocysteine nucleosidase
MSLRPRIALFAATIWEAKAVRAAFPSGQTRVVDGRAVFIDQVGAAEYWLVQTGVGAAKAGHAACWLFQQGRFHLAVSTGFACALVPAEIGARLGGCEVVALSTDRSTPGETLDVPGAERDLCWSLLQAHTPRQQLGRFLSVDRIVIRAADKQAHARATGAVGLDMESAALAREAWQARVPFVIVRTVSDLLEEDLPLDFNLFLRPTGWITGIASLLRAPGSLHGLTRLRRQSRTAGENLTAWFRQYAGARATAPSLSTTNT